MKINIEEIERLVKLQLGNGEAEALLEPIRELAAQRRYGLIWEEPKSGAYEEEHAEQALLENFPFLSELSEQAIVENEEAPTNLLIEGDNLHALQALQYSHKGIIDVIYIDPPYNTGNKDFIYNDRFVDAEDSWRHSSWLSFMNKRLKLAKELLAADGVIFISIDDNEMAQLKLLCDQVFGEQNFIEIFSWVRTTTPSNLSKKSRKVTEYVLCYERQRSNIKYYSEPINGGDVPLLNSTNGEKTLLFPKDSIHFLFKVPGEKVEQGQHGRIKFENEMLVENGTNASDVRITGKFKWKQEMLDEELEKGTEILIKSNAYSPRFQRVEGDEYKTPKNLINSESGVGTNEDGKKDLDKIVQTNDFDYPKPVSLVKYLLGFTQKRDAIVLDFFAGSGTTGQAVMELNDKDGGHRQYILCTNNEISDSKEIEYLVEKRHIEAYSGRKGTNAHKQYLQDVATFKSSSVYGELSKTDEYKRLGIARSVTYPRNKRVITGYTTPDGIEVAGLPNNLRYFLVNLKKDYRDEDFNAFRLIGETIDIIRIKENLYNHQDSVSINGIPVVKLVDEKKEILIVLDIDVLSEDIDAIIQSFEDEDKEHIIYTSYKQHPYPNIKHEDLPKEILRALKMKEMN